jgi:glycerol-3-phosphate dehydrogenase
MKRDLDRLGSGPFDVLVVGGGVYGAWTAYDAALRGLKVALIEKSDWASGTSSASTKLIHGGLRYLEQFHVGLVRRSLAERRRLALLGPHRVVPLRFLVPVYEDSRVGRLRLKAGLWLYDRLAGKKHPIGRHQSLTAEQVLARHGYIKARGLVGGFTYGDGQTDDALFVIEIVHGAHAAGAVTLNYVRATRFLRSGSTVVGASVVDELSGETLDIRASVVVNTTGMWPLALGAGRARAPLLRMSKGVHLVLPPLPMPDAMLITARRDSRVFFVIPWYGKTLLGTTDADFNGDPDDVHVDESEIDYLLEEAAAVIETPGWDRTNIDGMYAGVRALKYEPGKPPSSVTREWALESPYDRLLVSVGGKYTSARYESAVIVDRALGLLARRRGRSPTASRRFPWAPHERFPEWQSRARQTGEQLGMDRETAAHSTYRHGTALTAVHELIRERPDLARRLDRRLPFSRAEVVIGARDRMAFTLEDLLRRRTPLLILSRVRREILEDAASLAAPILGWDNNRREQEIMRVIDGWGRD